MFFRVRASLTERPGALARLATDCGDAGLDILGLQIFPDLGRVTDELVLSAPADWTAGAVAELVGGAGGHEVSVEACTTHDLIDQPTRWLAAAADVVADPATLAIRLEQLLGPHPEKWSATEHTRAAALRALAAPVEGTAEGAPVPGGSAPVVYDVTAGGVAARIGTHVVGVASFTRTGDGELTIEVAPAWRRQGIGTQLLTRAVARAADRGLEAVVLLAPAEDQGFVTLVCGAGLRARIKVTEGVLSARIAVPRPSRDEEPPGAAGGLPGSVTVPSSR